MSYLFGKAFDYNNFIKQVRGFVQGHPQVLKSNPKDAQSGITITGTGVGELFVTTESFTPAGNPGSPAGSPGPGTKYRLTCTVAGTNVSSPRAQFTVEQLDGISPSVLGTMYAGDRWRPDGDRDPTISPEASPGGGPRSPQHGLELILTTSTAWAVSDTIEFRLVDHFIGRTTADNFIEQRFNEQVPDANGDFVTEWICRVPSIANAGGSPETQFYTGMQSSFNDASSIFNVAVMAATGFTTSSSFTGQAGNSGARYGMLSNLPMDFWLTCDADGYYAVARVGSVYEHFTAQLVEVFATGNQHPLPIYVGAMSELNTNNSTNTDNDQHAAFWDPGDESTGLFRWVDGTWYQFENRGSSYDKFQTDKTRIVWPYREFQAASNHTNGQFSTATWNWGYLSHQMLARYDGSYELLPCTLIITNPQNAVIGDLKFVKYCTGNGVNAEDTTTDTTQSPNVEFIAFQNAQLTDNDNFCVMELVE